MKLETLVLSSVILFTSSCAQQSKDNSKQAATQEASTSSDPFANSISEPLVSERYSADPSARIFEGKIFIYPSHDYDAGVAENDNGDHFAMKDYYIYSMDSVGGKVTDHGLALQLEDVPRMGNTICTFPPAIRKALSG